MSVNVYRSFVQRSTCFARSAVRYLDSSLLLMLLVAGLATQGCATMAIQSKKTLGYDKQITQLTVLYVQRERMEFFDQRLGHDPENWDRAQKALDDNHFYELPEKLQRLLPEELEPYGVAMQLKVVSSVPESLDAYSPAHVLTIDPYRISLWSTTFLNPGPDGMVRCALSLYEAPSKEVVWRGDWGVALSDYRYLTDQEVRVFGVTLAKAFESERLVKKPVRKRNE
jgi:hypothetical protein